MLDAQSLPKVKMPIGDKYASLPEEPEHRVELQPTATSAGCPEPGRSSGRMTGSLRTGAIPCSGLHSAH